MKNKRLILTAAIAIAVGSFIFGGMLHLDRIPGNSYRESPDIYSQEYIKKYSLSKDGISLAWTYEHYHNVLSPALSPNGKMIVFVGTEGGQRALICLNDKAEKLWVYKGLECCPKNDLEPRILIEGNY